jgi:hypothetical protein
VDVPALPVDDDERAAGEVEQPPELEDDLLERPV